MTFLYPTMLLGLLGLALPVIVHLIARHKFPVLDVPSIRLLRHERRDNAFAARLVDPWQLLMRLLVLALLALAMSRLFSSWLSAKTAPRNLVVVMDCSASMRMAMIDPDEQTPTTPMDLAKRIAQQLLSEIAMAGRCALVLAGDEVRAASAFSPDPGPALQVLETLETSDGAGPGLIAAIAQGVEMVRGRREVCSQVVVLTDRGVSAFETRNQQDLERIESAQHSMGEKLEIVVVDVGTGEAENLAITDASLRGRQARIGDDAHVLARVRNCGTKPQSARLALTVPGTQDAPFRDLTVEPDEEVVVDLTTRVSRTARTFAGLRLAIQDAFAHDNEFSVPFNVAHPRRVLLVNGARDAMGEVSVESAQLATLGGGQAESQDEEVIDGARILQFVLNPGRELGLSFGTGIEAVQITPDALPAQTLSKYQLIILYDVSKLQEGPLRDLTTFVREGRALLIVCSGALNPMEFNGTFAASGPDRVPLSPVQIGNDLTLEPPVSIRTDATGAANPWLSPFRDRRRGDLAIVRFRRLREVRGLAADGKVLLQSDRGHVLAVESTLEEGRVVVLTFGVELGRGNLAMTKVFPFLTWRLVDYLTGRLRTVPPDALVASTPSALDVSDSAFRFLNELELAPKPGSDPQEKAEPTPLRIDEQKTALVSGLPVGHYWLQKPSKKGLSLGVGYRRPIAVNHDPRESNVRRVKETELLSVLGERARLATPSEAAELAPRGTEVWRLVIGLLIVAYLAEAITAYVLGIRRDREREGVEA